MEYAPGGSRSDKGYKLWSMYAPGGSIVFGPSVRSLRQKACSQLEGIIFEIKEAYID